VVQYFKERDQDLILKPGRRRQVRQRNGRGATRLYAKLQKEGGMTMLSDKAAFAKAVEPAMEKLDKELFAPVYSSKSAPK